MTTNETPSPFHPGEHEIQERAGVREKMELFGRKVIRDHMPDQHRQFYAQLPYIIIGSVDSKARPWASTACSFSIRSSPSISHLPRSARHAE